MFIPAAPLKTTQPAHTMRGVVTGIIYQGDDGFTVTTFEPHGQLLPVRIVGSMIGLAVGMELLISGRWRVHPEHGEQFQVENYALERPSTREGLIRYLGSRLFPGIGRRTAQHIVDKFGLDTLTILDRDINHLLSVKNIGRKKLAKIKLVWAEQRQIADLMLLLTELGVGPALAARIHKAYGDQARQVVRMTPFRLTELRGVGFLTADRIAGSLEIPPDAPPRIEAGVVYAQSEMIAGGHVCAPAQTLTEGTTNIDAFMYANEKANNKKNRHFCTSFVQNDKGKSILSVFHPDKNKRPFLFAVLADSAAHNRENGVKLALKRATLMKNQGV